MPDRLLVLVSTLLALASPVASLSAPFSDASIDFEAKVSTRGGLAALKEKVADAGRVRVIVTLNADVPFRPMGYLTDDDSRAQRIAIGNAQLEVMAELADLAVENVRHFTYTPQSALTVDRTGLDRLLASPRVRHVAEDEINRVNLNLSVPRIGAPAVWTLGSTGSGVAVAVLDTGVDKNHPFLAGAVVSEACYSNAGHVNGYNCGTGCNSSSVCPGGVTSSTAAGSAMPYGGFCPAGECDHGTHVSGIVAGRYNGSFSGVAPGASIIAIQVFTRFDGAICNPDASCALAYVSDVMSGLQRVVDLRNMYNIAAVNMSLGGGQYYSNCDSDARKPLIDTLRSYNIATVISSGNSGYKDSMGAPGCISSAISVGATTDSDTSSSYSNIAPFLSLMAPGSSINSSVPGSGYASWNGTSMAAPHVAGAWALMRHARPSATVTQILNAFATTGLVITYDDAYGALPSSLQKRRIRVDQALSTIPGPSLGPGKIGVFRNGFFFLDRSGNGLWDGTPTDGFLAFGTTGDVPVVGDWNGDGKSKTGIFRNGFFFLDYNGNGVWDGTPTDKLYAFGTTGDLPVVGDWNNSGTTKIGVYRNGFFFLDHNGNGVWDGTPTDLFYAFGTTGDLPVAGDWSGNGYAKIGVFRSGFFFLDYNGNGRWDGSFYDIFYAFGTTGDLPAIGDWNGNSLSKVGVYRNGFWFLDHNGNGKWDGSMTDQYFTFGAAGDRPAVGDPWN